MSEIVYTGMIKASKIYPWKKVRTTLNEKAFNDNFIQNIVPIKFSKQGISTKIRDIGINSQEKRVVSSLIYNFNIFLPQKTMETFEKVTLRFKRVSHV